MKLLIKLCPTIIIFISAINFLYAQAQPASRGGGSFSGVFIVIFILVLIIGLIIFLSSKKLKKKHVDVVEGKKKKFTGLEERFPALRTAAAIFKILAWLVGIATAIIAIMAVIATADGGRGIFGLGGSFLARLLGILLILISGGFWVLILYASAEWFLVMLAIEENTRIAAGIYPREETQGGRPEEKPEAKTTKEIEKEKEATAKREVELDKERREKADKDFLKY
jgi:hypothetical protein